MTTTERKHYTKARRLGFNASRALYVAKIKAEWDAIEESNQWDDAEPGTVRLRAEPEVDNYFDVYGEPEGYTDTFGRYHSPEDARAEICRQIELNGCLCVFGEYWDKGSREWVAADSIGMCIYDRPLDPFCNDYAAGIMAETMRQYRAQDEIPTLHSIA